MYGTTTVGGTFGVGTAYKLTTTGALTVLHAFGGIGDGGPPMAGLINVNGTLYGTTYAGGTNGNGTVFALAP